MGRLVTGGEIGPSIMAIVERSRHNLAAIVLWCMFLTLYLGGTFLLVIGLVSATQTWWAAIHQHADLWRLSAKTLELLIMAAGFILVLIIPLIQGQDRRRRKTRKVERGSEMRRTTFAADQGHPTISQKPPEEQSRCPEI